MSQTPASAPAGADLVRAPAPRLAGPDLGVLALVLFGFAVMFLPTYWNLSSTVWASDEQGHGPIILAVSIWLLYQQRHALVQLLPRPAYVTGGLSLLLGLVLYAFGRSQSIWLFEVSSQIFVLAALVLVLVGGAGLRLIWFPLFFLLFMVPLPEVLVTALTTPLKSAVSAVASSLLYNTGFPVGRAGVILTIGPYQLLVADACAGLNSMFTLEALGLLYMKLMNYTSAGRNVTLALLLVPISFVANIVRVMILVLVTYYFGDAAGQGFIHGFAGMVLFMVALAIMLVVDKVLNFFWVTDRRK
ncbi:exosortase B [Paucibacter sp. DJ1R-11]|uniref:exosortase B n=1 Tax=Paucibacter sp. DJ1R-11 TaxID=2893556 RepID=UPI0021E42B07|nr:exosortase B [Paucibacter sp. DJ1R-11]MCV2365062.1 exosortase B [Paucibacter sp. DJ1R-11]